MNEESTKEKGEDFHLKKRRKPQRRERGCSQVRGRRWIYQTYFESGLKKTALGDGHHLLRGDKRGEKRSREKGREKEKSTLLLLNRAP